MGNTGHLTFPNCYLHELYVVHASTRGRDLQILFASPWIEGFEIAKYFDLRKFSVQTHVSYWEFTSVGLSILGTPNNSLTHSLKLESIDFYPFDQSYLTAWCVKHLCASLSIVACETAVCLLRIETMIEIYVAYMQGCFIIIICAYHPVLERGMSWSVKSPWTEVWSTRFWMAHYGGPTPKRHIMWSSSRDVGRLDLGVLRGFNHQSQSYESARTATTEVKNGKKVFKGNKKALKQSQHLCLNVVCFGKWVWEGDGCVVRLGCACTCMLTHGFVFKCMRGTPINDSCW